jgi:hypothetical protein
MIYCVIDNEMNEKFYDMIYDKIYCMIEIFYKIYCKMKDHNLLKVND